jgi:hypothetical protein
LALYRLACKDFIPTNLYIDVMLTIKNALFCIAKAKIDDSEGEFWIILLGTDHLEELFGILRTMVENDTNLDMYQLVGCIAGTRTEKYQTYWQNTHIGTVHLDGSNFPHFPVIQRKFQTGPTTSSLHLGKGTSR